MDDFYFDLLQIFENNLVAVGHQLEAIVLSQRKQVQLGVKVTSDLYQLVKRFHQRWNQLKQIADERRVSIQKAQIKYDPANLSTTGGCGLSHVTLRLTSCYIVCKPTMTVGF